jgi:hypothetical protein
MHPAPPLVVVRKKVKFVAGALALTISIILAVLVMRKNPDPRAISISGVSLELSRDQDRDGKKLRFEFVNKRSSPIVCPDSFYVEFPDQKMTNLSLAPVGDVRINPGATGTVSIPKPAMATKWRLGASFYEENLVFDAKVLIGQSPLKNQLPSDFSNVRGMSVVSDWIQ